SENCGNGSGSWVARSGSTCGSGRSVRGSRRRRSSGDAGFVGAAPTGRTPRRSGTFRRAGLSGRGRDVERCPARLGQHGGYALARAPLPYRGDKATTDQFTRGGLIAEGQPVDEEVRYAAAGEFGHVLGHRSQGGPL